MTSTEEKWAAKFTAAGIEPETPLSEGVQPILAHTESLGCDPDPWLASLESLVKAFHATGIELWSALHFSLPGLLAAAGKNPDRFASLLSLYQALSFDMRANKVDSMRTEQYGVGASAAALKESPELLEAVLNFARRVAGIGADPGWLLEVSIPSLCEAEKTNPQAIQETLSVLQPAVIDLLRKDTSLAYALAAGLQALLGLPDSRRSLASWLDVIAKTLRSLHSHRIDPYSYLEKGIPFFVTGMKISIPVISDALEIGLLMADHGIPPEPTFSTGFGDPHQVFYLELAKDLAREAIDPKYPILYMMSDPDAERDDVLMLARQLHEHGHSLRKTFDEALPWLSSLRRIQPQLAERAMKLTLEMTRFGIDPGYTIAHGFSMTIERTTEHPWIVDEWFAMTMNVSVAGADPGMLMTYGFLPLLDIANEEAPFRRLRKSLEEFVGTLRRFGVNYEDVLFHDMDILAVDVFRKSEAFIELITRLQHILDICRTQNVDARGFLTQALPAVAKSAHGRPWVMQAALNIIQRLAQRGIDPDLFVREGVLSLVPAAEDETSLLQLADILERLREKLPNEMAPVVTAAVSVSNGRPEQLDAALQVLLPQLPSSQRGAGMRGDLFQALPVLAKTAQTPAELDLLLEQFWATVDLLAAHENALRAWLLNGIPVVEILAGKDASKAVQVLKAFSQEVLRWGGEAETMFNCGISQLAFAAEKTPATFFKLLDTFKGAVQHLARSGLSPVKVFRDLLGTVLPAASLSEKEFADAIHTVLKTMDQAGHEKENFLKDFSLLETLAKEKPAIWPSLLIPTLRAAGPRSTIYFSVFCYIAGYSVLRKKEDIEVLRDIVLQKGAQALSILKDVILPALRAGTLTDLVAHRAPLFEFIRDMGCFDANLYARYHAIHTNATLSRLERRGRIDELRDSFKKLADTIRAGELPSGEEADELLGVALMYVFPPTSSVHQASYRWLLDTFRDRPEDVLQRPLAPELRRRRYAIGQGSWQLRPGALANRDVWDLFFQSAHIAVDQSAHDETPAELGWTLLQYWAEGRLGRDHPKAEMLVRFFRYFHRLNGQIPSLTETAASLLSFKEIVSDRFHDLVEETLLAARSEDTARYDRMVQEKLVPRATVGRGLTKSLFGTLQGMRAGRIDREEAARRLVAQLQGFAVDEATVLDILAQADSAEAVRAAVSAVGARAVAWEPGPEVQRLHADWLGQAILAMQQDLFGAEGQPGILEYQSSATALELFMEVTKRRAHALVGHVEGVCVATDEKLWDRPDFFQVVFWSAEGVCRGGMHLLIVHDAAGNYLTLPGINPAPALLAQIEPGPLLKAALDYAGRLAQAWNLKGVWIPSHAYIHSNRQAIRNVIREMKWPELTIANQVFSYSPYSYSFDSVFVVPNTTGDAH